MIALPTDEALGALAFPVISSVDRGGGDLGQNGESERKEREERGNEEHLEVDAGGDGGRRVMISDKLKLGQATVRSRVS